VHEDRACEIAKYIGLALRYVHENGVLLRSLDSKSIVMTDEEKSKWKEEN